MKALNLNRLNVRTPYSVWPVGKQSYGFKTAYGVQYRIGFIDDQTIWLHGAYEFGIVNENGRPSPNDRKLRETIYAVIEEFFESNPEILLYQCETGDNRQAMRDRLFLHWFKEYENRGKFIIKVSKITAEEVDNYAAVIVQRNNPHLGQIIHDFEQFVGFFQNKPE